MRRRERKPVAPPRRPAGSVATTEGGRPKCLLIGPCVEVWGPDDVVPDHVPPGAPGWLPLSEYFRAASQRHWQAGGLFEARDPHQNARLEAAWSLDGRHQAPYRLRGVTLRTDTDPHASLSAVGCTKADIPALRAQAVALVAEARSQRDLIGAPS